MLLLPAVGSVYVGNELFSLRAVVLNFCVNNNSLFNIYFYNFILLQQLNYFIVLFCCISVDSKV